MKTDRLPKTLFFVIFAVLICTPSVFTLAGFQEGGAHPGKKAAVERPGLPSGLPSFSQFAVGMEAYYNDSFGLRRNLIRWNNRLRLMLFGESPLDNVRVGRDGWLYYSGEWSLVDYENAMPYSGRDLDRMEKLVEQRRSWLAKRGIGFYIVVAPNTQTIYPEHLPPGIEKLGPESRLDQVAERFRKHPSLQFVDLRDALLKEKSARRLYHRTDSHWNDYGAFVGYSELIRRIAKDYPGVRRLSLADFTVADREGKGGDLAEMLSLSDVIREQRIELLPKFTPRAKPAPRDYPNPVHHPGRDMVVRETGDDSLPKALVFRDSYCTALVPYLSESFRSVVYLWTFEFLTDIVEREKPDLVILECVERYLNALTMDNPEEVRAGEQG